MMITVLVLVAVAVAMSAGSSVRVVTRYERCVVFRFGRAAEKNSTLVLPFPVELLRFLERATPPGAAHTVTAR